MFVVDQEKKLRDGSDPRSQGKHFKRAGGRGFKDVIFGTKAK